ncbi:MAG TPA: hypothetical protein VMH00_07405 [Candidatus Limnocylindrales bacterium]|nr:hypothetical protein [Candidatus Limnocylindrales bacterium]
MNLRELFPATTWVGRAITHRIAQRAYLSIILVVLLVASVARISSLVLIRRVHRVLDGLAQLQIDHTTEAELLRTVPYLQRNPFEGREGAALHRNYYAVISNESQWLRAVYNGNFATNWRSAVANWIGFRYLDFRASVVLIDGRVSEVTYGIQLHPGFPRMAAASVYVRSFHGIWMPSEHSIWVPSEDDESPQYRVAGSEGRLTVSYAFDAPPNLVSHAFNLRLLCLLSLRGCTGAHDLAPLIWADKDAIQAATLARLRSNNPCPDRILAGRVEYLLDMDMLLLRADRARTEWVNEDGQETPEEVTDYSVVAVLQGHSRMAWDAVRSRTWIPSPTNPAERIYNRGKLTNRPGTQVLMFSHENFASCSAIFATSSALAAVKSAKPAPRLPEDQAVNGIM